VRPNSRLCSSYAGTRRYKGHLLHQGRGPGGAANQQATADGHEFGNHGLRHEYWAEFGDEAIAADLAAGAKAVQAAAGAVPRVVRPPYNYLRR
jgi:peptidoglycan/xylan/chitin deacetylase (PgdA/CDA1 family)